MNKKGRNKDVSVKRHIAKTISWRIVGTLDTFILSWVITGNIYFGVAIGGVEVVTKMALYFLHERIWYKSDYGLIDKPEEDLK